MTLTQKGICEISFLNEKGIGVAKTSKGDVYLPLTLPGEVIEFEKHLYRDSTTFLLKRIITPSENRVTPPCKYYGFCGGCVLQHAKESTYDEIKIGFIEKALSNLSIRTKINKVVAI